MKKRTLIAVVIGTLVMVHQSLALAPTAEPRPNKTQTPIRVTVYGENIQEHTSKTVAAHYPQGMHKAIADALNADPAIIATTVTLQDPEHGLTAEKLAETDVLFWWGHLGHEKVQDEVVERIADAVWSGMGAVFLHSSHFSKPFKRLMGTPSNLTWRNAGERERIWVISRNHPIAAGLPDSFELDQEEMYGEPFGVPEPLETVFISWFQGGEVFRSGVTYKRGAGKVFYFRPGDENYPTFNNANIQQVLRNAAHWAHNPAARLQNVRQAANRPQALESGIVQRANYHDEIIRQIKEADE